MSARRPTTALAAAADRLRALVLAAEDGAQIGSEEALVARLGYSRSTLRQVARLLEREGLLRVRRGINGGYFAARPEPGTVEATVSAYLEALHVGVEDATVIASALWVEVVRKAAAADPARAQHTAEALRQRVAALRSDATFAEVRALEHDCRTAIFRLADCRYIELIFDINTALANRTLSSPTEADDSVAHREFVRAWRDARLMELAAIAAGDTELGAMAARHLRNLWHRRVWTRLAREP